MTTTENPPLAYIGTRIPAILQRLERDESWLARKMGLHKTTVWRVLRGYRRITPDFVERACAVLNLPADVLFVASPASGHGDAAAKPKETDHGPG